MALPLDVPLLNPMTSAQDSFHCRTTLSVEGEAYEIFSLQAFAKKASMDLSRLPFSIKIMLENLLRNEDGRFVRAEDIQALATPHHQRPGEKEIAFTPARV